MEVVENILAVEHILGVGVAAVQNIFAVVDRTNLVGEQAEVAYKQVKYHLEVKVPYICPLLIE